MAYVLTKGAWLSFRFSLKVEREEPRETLASSPSGYFYFTTALKLYVVSVHEIVHGPYTDERETVHEAQDRSPTFEVKSTTASSTYLLAARRRRHVTERSYNLEPVPHQTDRGGSNSNYKVLHTDYRYRAVLIACLCIVWL